MRSWRFLIGLLISGAFLFYAFRGTGLWRDRGFPAGSQLLAADSRPWPVSPRGRRPRVSLVGPVATGQACPHLAIAPDNRDRLHGQQRLAPENRRSRALLRPGPQPPHSEDLCAGHDCGRAGVRRPDDGRIHAGRGPVRRFHIRSSPRDDDRSDPVRDRRGRPRDHDLCRIASLAADGHWTEVPARSCWVQGRAPGRGLLSQAWRPCAARARLVWSPFHRSSPGRSKRRCTW